MNVTFLTYSICNVRSESDMMELSSEYFGRYCKKLLNQLTLWPELKKTKDILLKTKDSLLKTEDILLKTKDGLLKTDANRKQDVNICL